MSSDLQRRRLIRESWDANAALWTNAVREGHIASRLDGTNRAIIDAIRATNARRILDVGCGEGWLAHRLEEDGATVTGFDGSADLIAAAETGPGRFVHLDYESFIRDPAPVGNDFDAAVCNFSLFDENLDPLLAAIAGRLTLAGTLIVQTVHPLSVVGDASYEDGWRTEGFKALHSDFREMPWYFRTLSSWFNLIYCAGFVLVRCGEPLSKNSAMPLSLVLTCKLRR